MIISQHETIRPSERDLRRARIVESVWWLHTGGSLSRLRLTVSKGVDLTPKISLWGKWKLECKTAKMTMSPIVIRSAQSCLLRITLWRQNKNLVGALLGCSLPRTQLESKYIAFHCTERNDHLNECSSPGNYQTFYWLSEGSILRVLWWVTPTGERV